MKSTGGGDAAVKAVGDRFIASILELEPVEATEQGEHRHDARWPELDAAGEKARRDLITATRAELAAIDRAALSEAARVDVAILEGELARRSFELDKLRSWYNDPRFYTRIIGDGLDPLVTRDFAPHPARMENLRQRLLGLPAVVAAARANLAHPSQVSTETAIQQTDGLIELVEGMVTSELAKDAANKAAADAAVQTAVAALRDLGTFLKNDLLPRSDGDFRRGPELFREQLRYSLGAEMPPDELYATARATLERTQGEMVDTARELWPELFPGQPFPEPKTREERMRVVKQALDKLAEDRPGNDTIVDELTRIIGRETDFVRQKDLMTVPDEPLRVVVVPEYKRGVAVGYCESSGPLEAKKETVVSIAPAPADWPPARVASFYREYNRSMLADFAIHEAMPGHYLQAAHANRQPGLLRAVFGSGAYAEGWAVYTEWLMAKHGFGGPRVRMLRQKMMLRTATNAILDHDIHAGQMTRDEAMKLMMEEALQEEGEAAGKWKRAQLSIGQLSTYFYGFVEIMKVRERAEKQPGFSERAFNDKLLSFGAPPPRFLAHLVLGDPLR